MPAFKLKLAHQFRNKSSKRVKPLKVSRGVLRTCMWEMIDLEWAVSATIPSSQFNRATLFPDMPLVSFKMWQSSVNVSVEGTSLLHTSLRCDITTKYRYLNSLYIISFTWILTLHLIFLGGHDSIIITTVNHLNSTIILELPMLNLTCLHIFCFCFSWSLHGMESHALCTVYTSQYLLLHACN